MLTMRYRDTGWLSRGVTSPLHRARLTAREDQMAIWSVGLPP
jgi:hypothetical protein